MRQKIFLSSVQKEFELERVVLHRHLLSDPVLQLFFEPILFEELPANGEDAQFVFLSEVAHTNIYIILIGNKYGFETATGISATEMEYNQAQSEGIYSLAFVKTNKDEVRHEKENALLQKIKNTLFYKRFSSTDELVREVTKSLVNVLQQKDLLQIADFDSSIASKATLSEIDEERVLNFIGIARYKRGFPLREGTALPKVLAHLNFLLHNQLTNSAILTFAKNPQQFFPSAVVKCAHFHDTFVAKPIPDHRVIKGTVFQQIDETIDFVLSKISVSVGTRENSNQVPLDYEIQSALDLKHRENFRDTYLNPSIEEGFVEMTIPEKPTSSNQTYRLTKKGLRKLKELKRRKKM